MKAKIKVEKKNIVGEIDKRVYSSFIEHLGRAVYGGVYEPDHPTADDQGFRQDVIDMVKKLDVPMVRYPGGNFVSGYNWEDGIGDKSKRPKKMELAWKVIEPNQVGIDEFQEWAKRANSEVMLAVNLGTRGPDEARNLVEYCNSDTDTYYANLRRENGFDKPFGIKTWCLGNEMDGDWQIGTKKPKEYARIAHEAAKLMRTVDPSIELVACGSCGVGMPTFGEWETELLNETYFDIDYISLHSYFGNQRNDTPEFLSQSIIMDEFIERMIGICDGIKALKNTDKTINFAYDEWNVWYHSSEQDMEIPRWVFAPPQLEDIYNLEDAMLVGSLLNSLLRHCDRVKIACLAQLVNVIAPIMTKTGGGVWAQTIFYPFMYVSKYGRGRAFKTECECEKYDVSTRSNVPYVDSVAVLSEDEKSLTVFAVNRSLESDCELDVELFDGFKPIEHIAVEGDDVKACNTEENPDNVVPVEKKIDGKLVMSPRSWNMFRFAL